MPLEITLWDVGQGDCSTLRLPTGEYIVIDTGPRGSPIIDWLNQTRPVIRSIILTHNDADHAGSLPAILQMCRGRIGTIYMLRDRPSSHAPFSGLFRLACEGEQLGHFQLRRLEAGEIVWEDAKSGIKLIVCHPSMSTNERASSPNQTSGILALTSNTNTCVIWGGDCSVPQVYQACVSHTKPSLLIGPHHGGPAHHRGQETANAIKNLSPGNAFISVGSYNKYSHPAARYLRRLELAGCNVRCSQLTNACDRPMTRERKHGALFPSHLLLGLPPPRSGFSCRGSLRYTIENGNFQIDHLEQIHQEKIAKLHRPVCLKSRRLRDSPRNPFRRQNLFTSQE